MSNWIGQVPTPKNEPVRDYLPNSGETQSLKHKVQSLSGTETEIPVIINGKEVKTGNKGTIHPPHNHKATLGTYHQAGPEEVRAAIQGALAAQKDWSRMPAHHRTAIFLKAAELLATKYRDTLNASTMLGQSKTCHQAEIDSACELIDFFRFNAHFQQELYKIQPESAPGMWNRMEYRPLEGFVFAVTPFNFTSISVNLPTAPALMGNVVLLKPASTSVYSTYFAVKLLEEAGLPPGVIQFLPGRGSVIGDLVFADENLSGVHFTGSTETFQSMWKTVGEKIRNYKTYPRVVGETGGKDFIFAHPSADRKALIAAIVRGAFEYQGQKCSAASRAYIPKSVWNDIRSELLEEVASIKMGDVADFSNFMGAVIDRASYKNISGYLQDAKNSSDAEILIGGQCDDSQGYFVQPTIIEAKVPNYRTMREEIFGPVFTLYVYEDNRFEETLKVCDETSTYGLTGCIFAQCRVAVKQATESLTHAAGNFYINNKPTGAVVGQQPFGGSRGSGTNDKAGSMFNLLRWVSARTVSETFTPPTNYRYPFLG